MRGLAKLEYLLGDDPDGLTGPDIVASFLTVAGFNPNDEANCDKIDELARALLAELRAKYPPLTALALGLALCDEAATQVLEAVDREVDEKQENA